MSAYKQVAVDAAKLISKIGIEPGEAWQRCVAHEFSHSKTLQKKGCPRSAFLGLCSDGYVVGVPAGEYTKSVKNKEYAIRAVSELKRDASLLFRREEPWKLATRASGVSHNEQLDVVEGLACEGLIRELNLPSPICPQ